MDVAAAAAASPSSSLVRTVSVWCSVMSMDGTVDIRSTESATLDARPVAGCSREISLQRARELGEALGQQLLQKGADKLLEGIVEKEGTGLAAPQRK